MNTQTKYTPNPNNVKLGLVTQKWMRESAELTRASGIMNAQLSQDIAFYAQQLAAALGQEQG